MHWRRPSRASWVPVLDTRLLDRLATGRKQETYFPVAVADDRFHCIILKGGDAYPYFPRPLLSEFDLEIPLTSVADTEFRLEQRRKRREEKKAAAANGAGDGMLLDDEDEDEDEAEDREARKLYQQYLLSSLSAAQLEDVVASSTSGQGGTYTERATLSRLRLEADKALLQLLALECRIAASAAAGGDAAADQRGMRALELVSLMHDTSGRMADAAGKVADRYGRALLGEKIRELAEKKVAEAEAEVDGDVL